MISSPSGILGIFALAIGISAPASSQTSKAQNQITPESIQGCYELEPLQWKPNLKLGEDNEFITPPRRIRLWSEHGSKGFETQGYLLRPAPGEKPSIHHQSYWKLDDSILYLAWTTGFSGLTMELHPEADSLVGKAKSFWDFPRRRQTAKVVAHRISCDK